MAAWIQILVTILGSVLGCAGFWSFLDKRKERKEAAKEKKSASNRMLLGLAHDRIIHLCLMYMNRGWISTDELEDLLTYLYEPYRDMGGNGTVKRLVEGDVKKLPVKDVSYSQQLKMTAEPCG